MPHVFAADAEDPYKAPTARTCRLGRYGLDASFGETAPSAWSSPAVDFSADAPPWAWGNRIPVATEGSTVAGADGRSLATEGSTVAGADGRLVATRADGMGPSVCTLAFRMAWVGWWGLRPLGAALPHRGTGLSRLGRGPGRAADRAVVVKRAGTPDASTFALAT